MTASARAPLLADRDLERAIRRAVDNDPGLGAHRVDVAVSEGLVTLTGRAGSGPTVQRLIEIAERTRGVLTLMSHIEISPPPLPDSEIRAAVATLLGADSALQGSEIEVSSENGRLTISGEVPSKAHSAVATELCWSARGVSAVSNRLTLRPNEGRSDAAIQHEIARRLALDAYLHGRPVHVSVAAGTVTLRGSVPSVFLKGRARAIGELVAATVVDQELRVEGVSPGERPITASDEETSAAVDEGLRFDPRLDGTRLGVRVVRGTVFLTGTVETLRQKLAAERSALETVGVWSVENTLQVRPALDLADDEIEDRVRSRIRHDAVAGDADVRVDVLNARAILRGSVASRGERLAVELAAAGEPALVALDSRLTVEASGYHRDDPSIADEIASRLAWDARVDASKLSLDVQDGVALLRGEVVSRTVYDATLESAFAAGAREVVSALRRPDGLRAR